MNELFQIFEGGQYKLIGRDGALASGRDCCCCVASGAVWPIEAYIDAVDWTGAPPIPDPIGPHLDCNLGFLFGIKVSDCRNLSAGGYLLDYYLMQCGDETFEFRQPFVDWMLSEGTLQDVIADQPIGFADVKSDDYFDFLFPLPTVFDPDRFAQCQQEWIALRNGYATCCNATPFCDNIAPYTGDRPLGPI